MADVILWEAQGKSGDVTLNYTSTFSLAAQTPSVTSPSTCCALHLQLPVVEDAAEIREHAQEEFIVQWFCAPGIHCTDVWCCEQLVKRHIS